jgi:serine/threonine-protein kinase
MSETNSFQLPDQPTGPTRLADIKATQPSDLVGHALFERIGVGGMGEVYRSGDDGLRRDLAIKVLRAEVLGDAGAEERFLREARLTGSLQHPGIVPVHQLGRLADGRPCYTMKLVRGRTLADLLRHESDGPERLPRLLAVVEKVCQAMAFAHSKGIIHRDLKPSNVMVGEFGEVQVMDWGLAKELSHAEPAPPSDEATKDAETVGRVEEEAGLSRAGAALGTPAYMSPEQAAGDWDIVDERTDVFALGAMLYVLLTGQPPYPGSSRAEVLRRARRGDLAEALGRLERCGADAALMTLCRECLALEREGRPRNAGVVTQRLAAYQTEVQERLRRAEVERAEAQVKAREERKRRRLTLALAVMVLLVVLGVGGGAWWWQQQRARADQAVSNGLAQANLLADQARAAPLQTDKYHQALEAAKVAAQLAETASAGSRRQARELITQLEQEEAAARKDRVLLAELLDVRGPREGPKYRSDSQGKMLAMAEPTADEQFAAAFQRWGLDVDNTSPTEAAALLKARPAVVVLEVIAALDEWASERRRQGKAKADAQRLSDLAAILDEEPDSKRRELREIMARGQLPVERALGVLSAALRPVPIPVEVPLGQDRLRLRQLAAQTDPASEPILSLLTLVRALLAAGEEKRAEQLLRAAIIVRPQEVVLHHMLGFLLTGQQPPRGAEVVECFGAARVARPDLGVNLATALQLSGRKEEGLALLARLVKEAPTNPFLHFRQAVSLAENGRLDEAIDKYHQAIALDPKYAQAHYNLGVALYHKGQLDSAMDEFRQAIALDPKDSAAHTGLGLTLQAKGQLDAAMDEHRQALALDPTFALAHNNLGAALQAKGQLDAAMDEFRQAIALDPKYAPAHNNLGNALHAKGRLDAAMDEFRQAIALDPRYAPAHYNLGAALHAKGRLDAAMDEFRQAIALDPKYAPAHNNLGNVLHAKGQLNAAVDEYRQALALDPRYAKAHRALGFALLQQGSYAPARESTLRALELLPPDSPLRQVALQQLRHCDFLLALDRKLPTMLTGEAIPANPSESVALAEMCQQHKKRYAASARFYADSFAAEPKLAAYLNPQHRYNAACSAALAAAGQGQDARWLPDRVVAMFRRWALVWLRDDLTAYAKLAQQNNPAVKQAIQQRLAHWRSDPDLASVRDPQAIDRLADNERAAWQALWRDVDELAKRVAKKDEPTKRRKEPEKP